MKKAGSCLESDDDDLDSEIGFPSGAGTVLGKGSYSYAQVPTELDDNGEQLTTWRYNI